MFGSVFRLSLVVDLIDLSKTNTSFDITSVSNSYDFHFVHEERRLPVAFFPPHDSYCQSFHSVSRLS